MKNSNLGSSYFFILALILFMNLGCQKNENSLSNNNPALKSDIPQKVTSQNVFLDSKSNTTFNIDNPNQLNNLVKTLAKEHQEITILESSLKEFKDSQGYFQAIYAKYKVGDNVTRLVVPLVRNGNVLMSENCEMKCTSAWGCQACTQTIIERCKKQTCDCTSGDGGCSSKITFN